MRSFVIFIFLFIVANASKEINIHSHQAKIIDAKSIDDVIIRLNISNANEDYNFVQNEKFGVMEENFRQMGNFLMPFVKHAQDEKCRNQLEIFLMALQNSSSWAVQLFDASSKLPSGLVAVNTYQFGDYDQCVEVNARKESIKGKYCLAQVNFAPVWKKYPDFNKIRQNEEFSLEYDFNKPVWEKFKVTKDPSKKRRDIFYSGVCIPNGCSAEDAEIFFNLLARKLVSVYGYDINVRVPESSCATNEAKEFRTGAKVLGSVIIFFLVSVFLCTIWDVTRNRKPNQTLNKLQTLMESFSLQRNLTKLTTPDPVNEMDVFHGMKTLSMILIIMGHRCMSSYGGPFFNPMFLEWRYRKFQDMLLLNGTLIVDTFFMIGGYLTFIGLFYECQTKKKLKPIQVYLYRWLRITPVYMLVVFFYGYLLEHLGNGPIWSARVGREAARCRENWWTNFLYINNYVNTNQLCMFQSWYVTCDMHYILIAPILVKLIYKKPKKGLLALAGCTIASIMIPFTITYLYEHDGVLRVYMSIFEDLAQSYTFTQMYIKTHNRAIPYFLGMAAAYFYLHLKNKNYQFSRPQTWILCLIATFCALSSICGAWLFYIPGRPYYPLENALYACLHRVFWAGSMAFVAIGGGRRAFGIIQPILNNGMYTPLSRLSYGAFLVHGAIQMYMTSTLRTPEYMCFSKLFWMTCGDVLLSFIVSLILHVIFEAPIGGIQKLLLAPKKAIIKLDSQVGNKQTEEKQNKIKEKPNQVIEKKSEILAEEKLKAS